jgi:hypothetical protein
MLWHERARLDIALARSVPKGAAPVHIPAQVSVRCNFCQAPLAMPKSGPGMPKSAKKAGGLGGSGGGVVSGGTGTPKPSACPNCNKPLPRCTVCLQPLGTTAGPGRYGTATKTGGAWGGCFFFFFFFFFVFSLVD